MLIVKEGCIAFHKNNLTNQFEKYKLIDTNYSNYGFIKYARQRNSSNF